RHSSASREGRFDVEECGPRGKQGIQPVRSFKQGLQQRLKDAAQPRGLRCLANAGDDVEANHAPNDPPQGATRRQRQSAREQVRSGRRGEGGQPEQGFRRPTECLHGRRVERARRREREGCENAKCRLPEDVPARKKGKRERPEHEERGPAHQPYPSCKYFGERVPPAVHGKSPEEAGPESFLPSPDHDGKQKTYYTWQHLMLGVEGDCLTLT